MAKIDYDVAKYQKAIQKVRNMANAIYGEQGEDTEKFVKYFIQQTALLCRNSIQPNKIENISPNRLPNLQEGLANAMTGVIEAYKALYHPNIKLDGFERAGSKTDLETDKKTLYNIANGNFESF